MSPIDLIFLAVALSMDSFAVALSQALCFKKRIYLHIFFMCFVFAIFPDGMPFLGWLIGVQFESFIAPYGKYITFGIFLILGLKMLIDGIGQAKKGKDGEEEQQTEEHKYCKSLPFLNHLIQFSLLGLATSIDAFVMGISFAALHVEMILATIIIFTTTFIFSFAGGSLGGYLGKKITYIAQIIGAIILILLAIKSLVV